jgi:hypothetical protein
LFGVKGIKNLNRKKGNTTVEAIIVIPCFLIIMFSLGYILRIFYVYNTVQSSLSEVARQIANMSYFYQLSGLKDYADRLHDLGESAEDTLEGHKNTFIGAFESFGNVISGGSNAVNSGSITGDDINNFINSISDMNQKTDELTSLISSIMEDPSGEIKLFVHVLTQKLSYELTNRIVCAIAKGSLKNQLDERVVTSNKNTDPARILGIKDGLNGIDFSNSSIFGDKESLDFVVNYKIKPPAVFGFLPEFKLSNRVKLIAWTGGRGKPVKVENDVSNEEGEDQDTTNESIWDKMDKDKDYFGRGLEIEKKHCELIIKNLMSQNKIVYKTPIDYPAVDLYSFDSKTKEATCYDIFTLNPLLKSYKGNPGKIAAQINKHGKKLLESLLPVDIKSLGPEKVKRVVIMIVPKNAGFEADEAVEIAKSRLESLGVVVYLSRGYGTYSEPYQELEEAA